MMLLDGTTHILLAHKQIGKSEILWQLLHLLNVCAKHYITACSREFISEAAKYVSLTLLSANSIVKRTDYVVEEIGVAIG